MSDPTPILTMLGLGDAVEEPQTEPEPADDAAPLDPTSAEASESQSLDEAFAELDGQAAPSGEVESEPEPESSAPVALTQEQIDAILAENEAFKAKEAEREAATADEQFLQPWVRQQQVNDAFFDAEVARIQEKGEELGKTQDEIDAVIYRRVELGQGFGVERYNPQTGKVEVLGRIAVERELEYNLRTAVLDYERSKGRPSTIDQMVTKYGLTPEQRTSLAKFQNYPPEAIETIAQTLGLNNQRVTTTLTEAAKQASQNLARNLSNGISPGAPGASAPKKPYVFKHTPEVKRQETEFVAARLGLIRPTG